MATDIQREESFRTALRNQKRRLSATESNKKIDGGMSLAPPRATLTPPRRPAPSNTALEFEGGNSKQSTPDIRLEFWDIAELSPLSTPGVSRSPSPYEARQLGARSPSPALGSRPSTPRSPLPPSSPLLCPRTASPHLNRVRSFNKEIRRAQSFRSARERSASRHSSAVNSRCSSPCRSQEEVSFSIKRSLGSRKGWKIMPDDGQCELDASALQSVVAIIKDMEIKGFAVPERISIKLP